MGKRQRNRQEAAPRFQAKAGSGTNSEAAIGCWWDARSDPGEMLAGSCPGYPDECSLPTAAYGTQCAGRALLPIAWAVEATGGCSQRHITAAC